MCQEQCRENLFENHEVGHYEMNWNRRQTMEEKRERKRHLTTSKRWPGVPRGEWGRGHLKGKDENYEIKPKMQDMDTGKYERSYGFYESSNKNKNESETKESS